MLSVKPFVEVRSGKVVVRPTLYMGKLRLLVNEAAIWPWQQRAWTSGLHTHTMVVRRVTSRAKCGVGCGVVRTRPGPCSSAVVFDSIQSPLLSGPVSVIYLSLQGALCVYAALHSQRSPCQGTEGEGWSGIHNSTL